MGIVKISDQLHDQVRISSTALGRSINAQVEHWLRVGQLAEHHPQLNYEGICTMLLQQAQRSLNDVKPRPVQLVGGMQ